MGWSTVSERKALIASFLSKSAQVFRDDCVGSRGVVIQSMHVACMCPHPRVLRAIMASCQHCWAGWVRAERASLRRHTAVSTYNAPSSGSISSQHLLCYATPQEKSETNTTKVDERWNCSVHLSWNPAVDSPNSWVAPLELIWVVTLITQSTDVPYITTWIVYCISEWRQIISYSWGECVEKSFFFRFHSRFATQINLMTSLMFGGFLPQTWHFVFLTALQFYEAFKWKRWYTGCIFLITCGSLTRSKKANTTRQCVHSRASSSPAAMQ